jgi:hypothetical protein
MSSEKERQIYLVGVETDMKSYRVVAAYSSQQEALDKVGQSSWLYYAGMVPLQEENKTQKESEKDKDQKPGRFHSEKTYISMKTKNAAICDCFSKGYDLIQSCCGQSPKIEDGFSEEESDWICTRNSDHKGKHVACSFNCHNMFSWSKRI